MAASRANDGDKKKASASKSKKAGGGTAKAPTRTSSRSAKRRSPKEGEEVDHQQLELERVEFLRAMDLYKRQTGKTFPTWTEVLDVIRSIGWMHPLQVEATRAAKESKGAASTDD